jgi:Xaa-Pro aminopeptidase
MKSNLRIYQVLFVGIAVISLTVSSMPMARAAGDTPPAAAIRITPPAPVFDDAKRLEELAARRKQVADTIGKSSIMVLFSAEPRVYTNDVDFPFRQENNLYYLTSLNQKRITLVIVPSQNPSEILFLPRRSPAAETWTGHMYSPEEAARLSGINEIWEASEFDGFIKSLQQHDTAKEAYRPKPENVLLSKRADPPLGPANETVGLVNETLGAFSTLYRAAEAKQASVYLLANPPANGPFESREYRQEQRLAAAWPKESGFSVQSAFPMFSQMRLKKSAMELEILQHAIDISIEAHQRAEAFASQAKWEYEVDAQVAFTFKLRNADNWGYPDIVGCGPNATTLHYEESQGPVKTGQLLLMDVGAEYGHYSADVTRTFPVNGKFSKEQAEVYQIVYDAQEAVAKIAKPGATLSDINRAATEVIKDGLLRLGLITDRNSDWQYRIWFMHGTGHWLGMNVHDVGGGAPFVPGAVFTNEPGIYVRPDALDNLPKGSQNEQFIAAIKPAFEKYKGIGVRIEDDMVITDTGVRWMTAALPRSIADIEAFIAKARR